MSDYDIVEYPHRPISQATPDRFAVVAALHRLQAVPLSRSRVLELGCGSGGNLIPLADRNPGARFHGIDLSETAIAQGRRRIDALGLANLRLEQMDLMDFPADAGEYDYIVAHGLYSWVPEAVRRQILALCQRHLAPEGIAYVSYNAYPGCHLRATWRDMMLFHVAQFDDPKQRIDQARGMIRLVARGTGRDDAAHRLAQEEDARCAEMSDSGIFHDDLAPIWQPCYFHEFAAQAGTHGLQFLGEAVLGDMMPVGIAGAALQTLAALEDGDRIIYQQYLDFFRVRRFRRTLLCRAGVDLPRGLDAGAMRRLHYAAQIDEVAPDAGAPAGSRAYRNRINDVTVTASDPLLHAALDALAAAWPSTLAFAELGAAPDAANRLCVALLSYLASSFIDARLESCVLPRAAGEHPEIWRVARLEAALTGEAPVLHHGMLQIEDADMRRLLQQLDGTRARAELAALCGGPAALERILAQAVQSAMLVA